MFFTFIACIGKAAESTGYSTKGFLDIAAYSGLPYTNHKWIIRREKYG